MRKETLFLAALIIGITVSSVFAQARTTFVEGDAPGPDMNRAQLMRELGLTKEQLLDIRRINQDTRPQKEAAGIKFRQARVELDKAIYADDMNENNVREKLRAVSEAQEEMTKINTLHEVQVRQVLTVEQLKRFREFRKMFAERKEIRQEAPKRNQNRRRLRNSDKTNDPPPTRQL